MARINSIEEYKYKKAKEYIAKLGNDDKDEHIRFYISKLQESLNYKNEELRKYKDFFEMFKSLLPKSNIVYK